MRRTVISACLAACAAVAALILTACSAASDDQVMSACLQDAQQDGSLENVDEQRVNNAAFNEAFEACSAKLGVTILPPGEETRLFDEMVLAQFDCMKAAGWNVPEPKRVHGGLVMDGMETNVSPDRLDAFDSDYQKCTGRSWLHPQPGNDGHDGHEHEHGHEHGS